MKKNIYNNSLQFSKKVDSNDKLFNLKDKFHFPIINGSRSSLYFCGNSLGLQPKETKKDILQEIDDWKNLAVEGHFKAKKSWFNYHSYLCEASSKIVGCKYEETVIMNSLTVNLHLLMVSFYKPNKKKKKILIEENAFPSDFYAVKSQLKFHNNDPVNDLIIVRKDKNHLFSTEKIINTIERNKDQIAMILLGGVNYLTGQLLDLKKITTVAKENGCIIGLDLAHAAGNVNLKLHSWGVDFAAWCGYKYLNGGPGAPSGIFINSIYHQNSDLKRFEGWWGHDKTSRFELQSHFKPMVSAEAWQLSNPPIFSMAALLSSLNIFNSVGMKNLLDKSNQLTSYLEYLLIDSLSDQITIISPKRKNERGCQLSIKFKNFNKDIVKLLYKEKIICDYRKPNILRIAPVPLYNSFEDCYHLVKTLKKILVK
tara:strand:+ start:5237 stop:6511 length:1275 start_codon:yes stop_codon:yes gene_type:complete